jgi:hypothetical protein
MQVNLWMQGEEDWKQEFLTWTHYVAIFIAIFYELEIDFLLGLFLNDKNNIYKMWLCYII